MYSSYVGLTVFRPNAHHCCFVVVIVSVICCVC